MALLLGDMPPVYKATRFGLLKQENGKIAVNSCESKLMTVLLTVVLRFLIKLY